MKIVVAIVPVVIVVALVALVAGTALAARSAYPVPAHDPTPPEAALRDTPEAPSIVATPTPPEVATPAPATHVVPGPPQLPPPAVGPPGGVIPGLTRIGGSGITATIPLLLAINDPVTGQFIRELRLEVENVDLTTFASSTLPANTFLSTAFANASSTLGALPISTRGTIIEDVIIDFDSSNNLVSIDVTANVEIFTTAYSERVRLELEGLPFTDFNPNSAPISIILNSIKANIINRFGE